MTQRSRNARTPFSRRAVLGAGASLLAGSLAAKAAPRPGFDGLYQEPWFLPTSTNLTTDFAETTKAKKNFAIVWEMRRCPWCARLHLENFARDRLVSYLRDNFNLVQLNIQAPREITDFDGEKLSEEALSYRYGIRSTPTIQFFAPSDAAKGREVGRIGYVESAEMLPLLRFIRERGYENGSFEDWVRTHKNPA